MDSFSDAQIIAGFSYLPGWQFSITIDTLVNPQFTTEVEPREERKDSLDRLPKEIQIQILEQCDLKTLSRLLRTSFKWHDMIQYLQAYEDVLEHCQFLISVLHRLCTLDQFSLFHLHRLLRSPSCTGCGNFGAYVFAVTCQRCCWTCSKLNPNFWVMPRNDVQLCFDLTAPVVDALPPIFKTGVPGDDMLVRVTDARVQAEAIHGSDLRRLVSAITSRAGDPFQFHSHISNVAYYTHALTANMNPQDHDPRMANTGELSIFEGRQLTIVSQLPPFDGLRLDHGCWCRGCAYLAFLAMDDHSLAFTSGALTGRAAENIALKEWAFRAGARE